jgi:phosphoglycolate phosphatase
MDSAGKIVRCFESAMRDAGLPSPGAAAIRNIIGLGLKEAVASLLPQCDAATQAQVVARYRAHFLHLDRTETQLFPGVREGLTRLAERGYRLAIATGKARQGLQRVLADTGLAQLFVASRCADEALSKPHPQMLLDILKETAVPAGAALMVGDTVYDMQMARSAQVDGLGVSYGVHDREELLAQGALACLDSFSEVDRWLG